MDPNNDKLKGTFNASVGSMKEAAGKAWGDKELQTEGSVPKTRGQAQKFSGAVKDGIKKGRRCWE